MDAETVKVWYELQEEYCDPNWQFFPENIKENITYGIPTSTDHFLLGRLKNKKTEDEYQFRVKINEGDIIRADYKKEGIDTLVRGFDGHVLKQSENDPHDFIVDINDENQKPILKGTLKVRMKSRKVTFTADAILVKETLPAKK